LPARIETAADQGRKKNIRRANSEPDSCT